jgi:hypothetical protein
MPVPKACLSCRTAPSCSTISCSIQWSWRWSILPFACQTTRSSAAADTQDYAFKRISTRSRKRGKGLYNGPISCQKHAENDDMRGSHAFRAGSRSGRIPACGGPVQPARTTDLTAGCTLPVALHRGEHERHVVGTRCRIHMRNAEVERSVCRRVHRVQR